MFLYYWKSGESNAKYYCQMTDVGHQCPIPFGVVFFQTIVVIEKCATNTYVR